VQPDMQRDISLRRARVDATGGWLVGAKSEYLLRPTYPLQVIQGDRIAGASYGRAIRASGRRS